MVDIAVCEAKEEIGADAAAIDSALAKLLRKASIHVNGDNITHTDYSPTRRFDLNGNMELPAGDEESSSAGRPLFDVSFELPVVIMAECTVHACEHSKVKVNGDLYV